MYEAITKDIVVRVEASFLDEQSEPENHRFFWAYRVEIENQSKATVQLLSRFWQITDSMGSIQEVNGVGVVGEQPVIPPGETYVYTSGAPLTTPSGFMAGSYRMENKSGDDFDVKIPTFSLDSPYEDRILN